MLFSNILFLVYIFLLDYVHTYNLFRHRKDGWCKESTENSTECGLQKSLQCNFTKVSVDSEYHHCGSTIYHEIHLSFPNVNSFYTVADKFGQLFDSFVKHPQNRCTTRQHLNIQVRSPMTERVFNLLIDKNLLDNFFLRENQFLMVFHFNINLKNWKRTFVFIASDIINRNKYFLVSVSIQNSTRLICSVVFVNAAELGIHFYGPNKCPEMVILLDSRQFIIFELLFFILFVSCSFIPKCDMEKCTLRQEYVMERK